VISVASDGYNRWGPIVHLANEVGALLFTYKLPHLIAVEPGSKDKIPVSSCDAIGAIHIPLLDQQDDFSSGCAKSFFDYLGNEPDSRIVAVLFGAFMHNWA
jgi:hypothetical protein